MGFWKEKNKRIFEDKKRAVREVIDSSLCELCLWLMVKEDFKDCSLNALMRDWVSCV